MQHLQGDHHIIMRCSSFGQIIQYPGQKKTHSYLRDTTELSLSCCCCWVIDLSFIRISEMTLLLHDDVCATKKKVEERERLLKQLCFCTAIALIPLGLINAFFFYSSFIPDEGLLYSLHSASFGATSSNTTQEGSSSQGAAPTVDPALGDCDVSKGKWVPDSQSSLYTNDTCQYIQGHQNCLKNGRPDRGYLNWRWKPDACELPRFDPSLFLELMRGKKMVFIGDSIARNHMQALLCALAQVEKPQNLYRDPDDKDVRWEFPSYNFTIAIFWSPFLVKHFKERDNVTQQTKVIHIHLDAPEEVWKSSLAEYDVAVVSTGPWYFKGSIYYLNDTLIGCHHCSRNLTKVGFTYAFKTALENTLNAMAAHEGYRGTTILRTFSVEHFEFGEWWNGGTCNRTGPFQNQSLPLPWMASEMHRIQVEEFGRAASKESGNGSKLKLLDVTYSAFLRPDGHPGPYRTFQPFAKSSSSSSSPVQSDCLHWCLPGPIDMWNELILKMLKERR